MRRKPIKHQKHEKLAITAFIVTLAIAILAFYYAYQQNVQYGKTVAGVMSYACLQYLQANPSATSCPAMQYGGAGVDEYFVLQKETLQNSGCISVNSVCYDVQNVLNNEAYSEYLLSACSPGDKQCYCDKFASHFEANTDITTTKCLAVDDKCPFIHKKVCPT
jgi:hypothetical protein